MDLRNKFRVTAFDIGTPRRLVLAEFSLHQRYRDLNGAAYSQIALDKQGGLFPFVLGPVTLAPAQ